jgi:O-antigen ligase
MNGPAGAEAALSRRSVWLWALGYVALAWPFLALWPDFETARRGIGNVLGGAALVGLVTTRGRAGLPVPMLAAWAALVAVHLLSCLLGHNLGDGLCRTAWLLSLGVLALLAARTSTVMEQCAAIAVAGAGVAVFGLGQALGMPWPLGYSDPRDPVSTLGNRNVAAEFTVLAVVGAALLVLRASRAWRLVGAATVTLGVAYLWVNHSRSGLLAGGLTVIPLILAPWRRHTLARRALLLGAVLVGLAGGMAVRGTVNEPAPAAAPTTAPPAPPAPIVAPASTIEVRFEIWRACLRMIAAAPLVGVGAAQFKVEYPRYRTQREIELSTNERAFAAAPMTAHNDPLEVAVETGVLGLALYVAFFVLALRRGRRVGATAMAPMVAFLILSLVRSPLGNAPAAAFALACLGAAGATPLAGAALAPWLVRAGGLALALGLLVLGARECAGQCAAAPHLEQARKVRDEDRASLVQVHAMDRAVAYCPWDSQLLAMRAALRVSLAHSSRDAKAARTLVAPGGAIAAALQRDPFDTTNLLRAATTFQLAGDTAAAERLLRALLQLDPAHPEARLFVATLRAEQGDAGGAIAALYAEGAPHPRLRERLAQHLADLAAVAPKDAAPALQHESTFIAAIDALQRGATATALVQQFKEHASRDDLRFFVLLALASLRAGDAATAVAAGTRAPAAAVLAPAHAELLATLLPELRALPAWAARLPHELD